MSSKPIYAISLCGRLTLDMHALNNEGTEGNQMLTRQVTIVDDTGNLHTVNAISGDMLKHIQAEHLLYVALTDDLPISQPCRRLDPNRIAADRDFLNRINGKKDAEVTDEIIKTCAITDMEGILLTERRATPRNSVIEFGWLVGLPEKTRTESYIHLKRVADAGEQTSGEASNLGQNLFHRPASSGIYAAVVHVEVARIGFNDFTRAYPITPEDRNKRYKALLKSILFTFLQPSGAQRNTQLPHILGFSGVIGIAYTSSPAPTVSPLLDGYQNEISSVAETMKSIVGQDAIQVSTFDSLAGFAKEVKTLISCTVPYSLA
jgi:CRISPR-associated protein Cst2